ncbi:TetR/AcrR family transcriptional regulator [Lapidilactobacillus wuchangensis]|uniref:TetR/AcrR family transcriptional regulator n=1 Tax=Lapidilactobacillus wuchangensis TaxID=2486001 RepID=UPI000F770A88|nr:TetR/AcrR family transcriptional regulator [Lapidilactobacillus wuchangensis]
MSPQEIKNQKLTAIYRALLATLNHQNMNEISISKLCQHAGVSRTYFYHEFGDFETIITKYQERAILAYIRKLPLNEPIGLTAAMVQYFQYVADSAAEQQLIVDCDRATTLITTFEEAFTVLAQTKRLIASAEILKQPYYVSLLAAGVVNVSIQWLKNGCLETPAQMGHLINRFIHTIPTN